MDLVEIIGTVRDTGALGLLAVLCFKVGIPLVREMPRISSRLDRLVESHERLCNQLAARGLLDPGTVPDHKPARS